MLELPFKAHNSEFTGEAESDRDRIWSVNLGDINFTNKLDPGNALKELDVYEKFHLSIDNMGLRYLKKDHISNVLEEVSLVLEVGVKNKLKAAILQGESN